MKTLIKCSGCGGYMLAPDTRTLNEGEIEKWKYCKKCWVEKMNVPLTQEEIERNITTERLKSLNPNVDEKFRIEEENSRRYRENN